MVMTHFLAGVVVSIPPIAMLLGCMGLCTGNGNPFRRLAMLSNKLFPLSVCGGGPWEWIARQWAQNAGPEDTAHVSKFRIPTTLFVPFPKDQMKTFPYGVAWQ